jgi:hypothetical protein
MLLPHRKVKPETTYDNFVRDFGERLFAGLAGLSHGVLSLPGPVNVKV